LLEVGARYVDDLGMQGRDLPAERQSRYRLARSAVPNGREMLTRVGGAFKVLAAVLCAVSLPIPHYVRPGGWTVTFVGIMVGELLIAALLWLTSASSPGLILPIVLTDDAVIVLAVACLEDRSSARLVAVLLVLPTLFAGMFLSRTRLIVQAGVVAAAAAAIMALARESPGTLTIHVVIIEVAVLSPAFAVLSLRESLARALKAKHRLALVDPLTSLANRRGLTEQAPAVVRTALERGLPVAVLVADLDHFKRVNDTWGHRIGDEVLLILAQTVRASVAADDLVVRLGGEEVAVVAAVPADRAAVTAERIRVRVGQRLAAWQTTVSVGVAWADPGGVDPESLVWDLVGAADSRLYRAKEAGRNRVVLPV
jgi:diguanylate cyclase (GGDEF)-like protein